MPVTAALREKFPAVTTRASTDHPAVNVPAAAVVAALRYLRDGQGFDFLTDLTAVDWGTDAPVPSTVS